MRNFGMLYCAFWASQDTQDLSDSGKLLAAYLLTGQHTTLLGCFRLPFGYVQADLRWDLDQVTTAFEELSQRGFAAVDGSTGWVQVLNYLKWNKIENPNQGKSAARLLAQIPDHVPFKPDVVRRLEEFSCHLPKAFGSRSAAPSEPHGNRLGTPSKPLPNKEKEQKKEQDQDQCEEIPLAGGKLGDPLGIFPARKTKLDLQEVDDVVEAWNAMAIRAGVHPVQRRSAKLMGTIRMRLKQPGWLEAFREALPFVERSDWHRGKNDSGWKADLDWMLKPGQAEKFANRTPGRSGSPRLEGRARGANEAFRTQLEEINIPILEMPA